MRLFCVCLLICASAYARENGSRRVTPIVLAVNEVLPTVVNISTERVVTPRYNRNDPFAELFKYFFDIQDRRTNSLGSGVLVDKRGLVITNDHVIQRASRIIVTLADGSEYDAIPVASNAEVDLALLVLTGLERGKQLQAVGFGSPDDLYLGEQVIAVGNPFGYGHSVAVGVLSAVKRQLVIEGDVLFEEVLQTDAPINPGNSGGPLLNADGELIGVSVAVQQGAQGIGFGVPLKLIEEQLCTWMIPSRFRNVSAGIVPATVSEDDHSSSHVVVREVLPGTPAEIAGLKAGAIIRELNGQAVLQAIDVSRALWHLDAGDRVRVKTDDATITFRVEPMPELSGEELGQRHLKIQLQELSPRLAIALSLPYARGLVVSGIDADSALAKRGLQRGDVIIKLGELPITNFNDLGRALGRLRHGDMADIIVDRVDPRQGRLYRYLLSVQI
jgi:S1-C subfamily serine protease